MTTEKKQNRISDFVPFGNTVGGNHEEQINQESSLILDWDSKMPEHISELYMPVAILKTLDEKQMYLAEYRMDESRAVIVYATGEAAKSLKCEADVMDLLVLTCIPRKISFYEEEDRCILVREYVNGESLRGAVNRTGVFFETEVCQLAENLCILLTELYSRHLSVNSSCLVAQNIWVTPEGRMKFVEPEGIFYCDDHEQSHSENIRAIGELMCFLLTGKNNLTKEDKKTISKPMYRLIRRCLRPEANERFLTIAQIERALELCTPKMIQKKRKAAGVVAAAALLGTLIIAAPFIRPDAVQEPREMLAQQPTGIELLEYGDVDFIEDEIPAGVPDINGEPDAASDENTGTVTPDAESDENTGTVTPDAEDLP